MVVPKSAGPHMGFDASSLRYHLLVPHVESTAQRELLADAYRCWRVVWGQTLLELDGSERVFSDDLTRQHELGALFYAGRCIGLTGYRWLDLSLCVHRDDSYFKVWQAELLEEIAKSSARVCVGSNLTVLPEWRGSIAGYSVKEILMALAVERFLASDADAMLGTMRNDRGMNGLVYRLGARALVENVVHHGVAVDLVRWTRGAMGPVAPRPATAALVRDLWCESWIGRRHEERAG